MKHLIITQYQLDAVRGTQDERSLGQCGTEAHTVSCDGHMTLDQVMYMLTRLRGVQCGEPSGARICMWKTEEDAFLSIGLPTIVASEWRDDIACLRRWIEDALEDEFE